MEIKVLIIDDEELICKMLKGYLEVHDMIIDIAECGKKAIELLNMNDYNAAIVDMRLPDMNGEDLIVKAHEINSKIHFFIHTGSLDYNITERLRDIGLDDDSIINKPVVDMGIIYDSIMRKIGNEYR